MANTLTGCIRLPFSQYAGTSIFIVAGVASLMLAGLSMTLPHKPPSRGEGARNAPLEAIRLLAVPSILAAPSATEGTPCRVVGDARRGSFWISRVKNSGVVIAPELTDEEGLRRFLSEAGGETVVTFEAGARNGFPTDLDIARETPAARLLWEAWQKADATERERWAAEAPQPLYLRPPHITEAKRKF